MQLTNTYFFLLAFLPLGGRKIVNIPMKSILIPGCNYTLQYLRNALYFFLYTVGCKQAASSELLISVEQMQMNTNIQLNTY